MLKLVEPIVLPGPNREIRSASIVFGCAGDGKACVKGFS